MPDLLITLSLGDSFLILCLLFSIGILSSRSYYPGNTIPATAPVFPTVSALSSS